MLTASTTLLLPRRRRVQRPASRHARRIRRLGIEVGAEDGAIRVIAQSTTHLRHALASSPATSSSKIDDKLTRGMNLTDAVKLMRGKPRTSLTLTIAPQGETSRSNSASCAT